MLLSGHQDCLFDGAQLAVDTFWRLRTHLVIDGVIDALLEPLPVHSMVVTVDRRTEYTSGHHRIVIRAEFLIDDRLRNVVVHVRDEQVERRMNPDSTQAGGRIRAQDGVMAFFQIATLYYAVLIAF